MPETQRTIEVEATHVTRRGPDGPRLVCELYPEYFIVDGGGAIPAHMAGTLIDRLPAGSDRTFPISEARAEEAAEWYENRRDWREQQATTKHLRD